MLTEYAFDTEAFERDARIAKRIPAEDHRAVFRIANGIRNNFVLLADFCLEKSGEYLFSTGPIKPGHSAMYGYYKKDLSPGRYSCRVLFYAVDEDSGEILCSLKKDAKLLVRRS